MPRAWALALLVEAAAPGTPLVVFATDPTTSAWTLDSDGHWTRSVTAADGTPLRDYQRTLLDAAAARADDGRAESRS